MIEVKPAETQVMAGLPGVVNVPSQDLFSNHRTSFLNVKCNSY
jgi:hypothetical protein